MQLPVQDDVRAAQKRLAGDALVTPLLRSDMLDAAAGRTVLVKAECLQWTGSFKYRGARNRILAASAQELAGGVVAYSSGNHAQGVALAAKQAGIPCCIVMPEDTPSPKVDGVRARGGEVVFYDRIQGDREAMARKVAADRGALLIPPFDDPHVIAGQGTIGLEILDQTRELGIQAVAIVTNLGGGGLTAGIALALQGSTGRPALYGTEPEQFDDYTRSLASGRIKRNEVRTGSICDALMSDQPGDLTFAINRHALAGGLVVTDAQVRSAMAFAFRHLNLVLEPGGAASMAAVLQGLVPGDGAVVVVATGGNVAPDLFRAVIAED